MRNRALACGLSFVFAAVTLGACATQQVRDGFTDPDSKGDAGDQAAIGIDPDAGPSLGVGKGGKTAEVEGVTYAPNGKLKLSGVLVYWTRTEPDAIPDGVYCDTCVELPEGTSAISGADGKFSLKVPAEDDGVYLVAQKGQFRRVRKINVAEDASDLDKELTTLPGRTNTSKGDTIPKIALLDEPEGSSLDPIQVALEGLGIEEWDSFNSDHDRVQNDLSSYHIAMFPCGADGLSGTPKPADVDAIRAFVAAGGKIYASDYNLGYASKSFPEFFASQPSHHPEDEPSGSFSDDGLSSWLDAIGDNPSNATFQGVWSQFNGLQSAMGPTPENDGSSISLEPKVWAQVSDSGFGSGEASISFPYGCGRGMASIFHVHGGDSSNLLQQEKALLYMLLEVSACVTPGNGVH